MDHCLRFDQHEAGTEKEQPGVQSRLPRAGSGFRGTNRNRSKSDNPPMTAMPRRLKAGIIGPRKIKERPIVGRRAATARPAASLPPGRTRSTPRGPSGGGPLATDPPSPLYSDEADSVNPFGESGTGRLFAAQPVIAVPIKRIPQRPGVAGKDRGIPLEMLLRLNLRQVRKTQHQRPAAEDFLHPVA